MMIHRRSFFFAFLNFEPIPAYVSSHLCSAQIVLTNNTADSPYPSTPTLSPFNSDPSVAGGEDSQNDLDPFKTPATVVDEVQKALMTTVATTPSTFNPQHFGLQGSHSSAEGMVRHSQTSANVSALGRSASHLERPFTRGESRPFHHSPRQYTLGRKDSSKSNGGIPNEAFVLRSAPQIIEEDSSDDEFWFEDQDDAVYSFPCEDSKINELVSAIADLSLGSISTVASPTNAPTRLHAHTSPFVPACIPASSPVAVLPPVVTLAHISTTQHGMPMEVDQDVPYPKVPRNDAPHPQGTPGAVPMDGLVFHPEANDADMADTFVTIRELLRVAFYFHFPLIL